MSTYLAISATEPEAARLLASGPRRDFFELAAATGGELVYGDGARHRGWRGKIAGPHVRQAWQVAGRVRQGDSVFADGEHVGLPLAAFLAVRRKKPARLVVLGHLVGKPWKLALLALATRLGVRGTLVLHSVAQAERARRWVGRGWRVALVPYQVDTAYWSKAAASPAGRPLVLAVGSENRDYDTLAAALREFDVDVTIAAGSHWARETAGVASLPANVQHLVEPLGFVELRALYARASVVAVPLHNVANQSGVTTILEAMSMEVPVVVTASEGQRECVAGPLVRADGTLDPATTGDRGPQVIGGAHPGGATGLYALPGNAASLRAAVAHVLAQPDEANARARRARQSAEQSFGFDQYVARLGALLDAKDAAAGRDRQPARALA